MKAKLLFIIERRGAVCFNDWMVMLQSICPSVHALFNPFIYRSIQLYGTSTVAIPSVYVLTYIHKYIHAYMYIHRYTHARTLRPSFSLGVPRTGSASSRLMP